jgi:hypothetical protein
MSRLTALFDKLNNVSRNSSVGGVSVGDFVRKKPKSKKRAASTEKGVITEVFSTKKKDGSVVIKVKVWMESGKLMSKQEFNKNYVKADDYSLDTHSIDVTDERNLTYRVTRKDGEEQKEAEDVLEEKVAEEQKEEEEKEDEEDETKWMDEFDLIEQFWQNDEEEAMAV